MTEATFRILYLTDKSDRGESATIRGVHDRGHRVVVFGRADSPHVTAIRDHGVAVTGVSWKRKLDRSLLRRIRQTIRDEDIDIVHAMNSRTTLHMVLATRPLARAGRSPRLVAYLGVTGNVSWWSPLSWLRFLNPRIDRIVCVAEGVRRYLLGVTLLGLHLPPERVVTIHKGHELSWYTAQPADRGALGIPRDATLVTVASRLRPRKGLLELIQALGRTDPAKNIHVLFLGHEGNSELHRAAAALTDPGRVHFAGFRRDAPAIMAASDICCLPVLRGEGLSRAVIEGMAYGVTPLVTDVGGNTELVIDGESGLVVPPGDVPALAEAIEWLHDHPLERQRMGRAARERIAGQFRNQDTVEKTLALYRELLQ
ncbi:glycosyltransferase [Elongatibacter sediminis]|uniref:Glycosyltransferase n=1 Tax=Elongatibacter sediminis TaxID=3119006 RepID=A0AAW9RM87_9GAMM